jgi:hypothetical protein
MSEPRTEVQYILITKKLLIGANEQNLIIIFFRFFIL